MHARFFTTGFCAGLTFAYALLVFAQDCFGLEGWIALLRARWLNLSPWYGGTITAIVVLLTWGTLVLARRADRGDGAS